MVYVHFKFQVRIFKYSFRFKIDFMIFEYIYIFFSIFKKNGYSFRLVLDFEMCFNSNIVYVFQIFLIPYIKTDLNPAHIWILSVIYKYLIIWSELTKIRLKLIQNKTEKLRCLYIFKYLKHEKFKIEIVTNIIQRSEIMIWCTLLIKKYLVVCAQY